MAVLCAIGFKHLKGGPIFEADKAKVTKAEGVNLGLPRKPSNRQVTILSLEQWLEACSALNITLPWFTRRANLLVSGIEFNAGHIGKVINIGDLQLLVTGETEPCYKMDWVHPGLSAALNCYFRAGVTCKVINNANIEVGNAMHITEQLSLF
ncbi:molybdenum cofactor biosysynthesis protein [Pseudoalteromonas sp. C2R02]|uniref:MOSC domain-containing protein n=1 Tax=Pseudoalteromonas sp. C2R02 TaxID=2841565 RepID=UPI001C07F0B0|nr:MOSC domain-containing protein [Pseudoalteromonas sp. C2R02]MBU2972555.1 molybdenum cofactor biosysynthesis protein [Pseudoalteromonas sp. C2R02]